MSLSMLRDRLNGLLGTQVADSDLVKLLEDVISTGGGIVIEADEQRFRLVRREGKFELKKMDPRRPSSVPPFR